MPAETSSIIVGVPKETIADERRVALVPADIRTLTKAGFEILVESGAGQASGFTDDQYSRSGAKIVPRGDDLNSAAILVHVRACGADPNPSAAAQRLRKDQILIALCDPLSDPAPMELLAERGISTFSLELVPRITRAQSMDVLSSMATIAGYKAVLIAANAAPRMFPMMMTAAGTLTPARVFVLGAGVAGLQAISTARRLGAVVQAYDVRPAAREQIQSVGGKAVDIGLGGAEGKGGYARAMDEEFYRRQREGMARFVADNDIVITTASVPGKRAPVLIKNDMLQDMAPGSVLVDLAAERGGNCEATKPGESVTVGPVTVIGPLNLPSTVPFHASQMFSRNVAAFLRHLASQGLPDFDANEEILRETLVTHRGQVVHPGVRDRLGLVST